MRHGYYLCVRSLVALILFDFFLMLALEIWNSYDRHNLDIISFNLFSYIINVFSPSEQTLHFYAVPCTLPHSFLFIHSAFCMNAGLINDISLKYKDLLFEIGTWWIHLHLFRWNLKNLSNAINKLITA